MRQEVLDLASRMPTEPHEHIGEIDLGVDVVCDASRDEGHEPREVLSRLVVTNEEPVVATQGDAPQGSFGAVVVDGHPRVGEEDLEGLGHRKHKIS